MPTSALDLLNAANASNSSTDASSNATDSSLKPETVSQPEQAPVVAPAIDVQSNSTVSKPKPPAKKPVSSTPPARPLAASTVAPTPAKPSNPSPRVAAQPAPVVAKPTGWRDAAAQLGGAPSMIKSDSANPTKAPTVRLSQEATPDAQPVTLETANKFGARMKGYGSIAQQNVERGLNEAESKAAYEMPDINVKDILDDAQRVRGAKDAMNEMLKRAQTAPGLEDETPAQKHARAVAEVKAMPEYKRLEELSQRTEDQILNDAAKRNKVTRSMMESALLQRDVPISDLTHRILNTDVREEATTDHTLHMWSQRTGLDANTAGSQATGKDINRYEDARKLALQNLQLGRVEYNMTPDAGLTAEDANDSGFTNKPGEVGFAIAQQIVNEYLRTGGTTQWFNPMEQTHRGYQDFLKTRVNDLLAKQSMTPDKPGYDAAFKSAVNRAIAELAAAKTVGLWTSPIFLPKNLDYKSASWGDAIVPGLEIVGESIRKDGSIHIVTRQETPFAYTLNTAQAIESAGAGALRRLKEDTSEGSEQAAETKDISKMARAPFMLPFAIWGLATNKSDKEVVAKYLDAEVGARRGVLRRDNLFELGMQLDWAQPNVEVDPTTGEVRRSDDWHMWVAGGGGLVASMVTPDLFGAAGEAVTGGAHLVSAGLDASKARAAAKILDDITVKRAAAQNLYEQARDVFEASREAEGITKSTLAGRHIELLNQAQQSWDHASRLEGELRDAFPHLADELDRYDSAIATNVSPEHPELFDRDLANRIPIKEQPELSMHPSSRRADLKSGGETNVQYAYKRLYDTGGNLQALDRVQLADESVLAAERLAENSKRRLARLEELAGEHGADIRKDLKAALEDPDAWSQKYLSARSGVAALNRSEQDIRRSIESAIQTRVRGLQRESAPLWEKLSDAQEQLVKRRVDDAALTAAGINLEDAHKLYDNSRMIKELSAPDYLEKTVQSAIEAQRAKRVEYAEQILMVARNARAINAKAADFAKARSAILLSNETRAASAEVLRLRLMAEKHLAGNPYSAIVRAKGEIGRVAQALHESNLPREALPPVRPLLERIGNFVRAHYAGLVETSPELGGKHAKPSAAGKAFGKKFAKHFNLDKAQQAVVVDLAESHARVWAELNGKTVDEWYKTHIAGIFNGFTGEKTKLGKLSLKRLQKSETFRKYVEDLREYNYLVSVAKPVKAQAERLEELRKLYPELASASGEVKISKLSDKWLKDKKAAYSEKLPPRVSKKLRRESALYQNNAVANNGWLSNVNYRLRSARTAKQLAAIVEAEASDPALRAIAKKLGELVDPDEELVITQTKSRSIEGRDVNVSRRRYATAQYDQYLPGRVELFDDEYSKSADTAVHELVHAVTSNQLLAAEYSLAGKGRKVSQDVEQAYLDLKRLFDYTAGKIETVPGLSGKQFYGMKNVHEFVAEALSNPQFQDALRRIPAPTGFSRAKNAFDWLWQKIHVLLGLDTHTSVLNDVIEHTARMSELGPEHMASLKRAAQEFGEKVRNNVEAVNIGRDVVSNLDDEIRELKRRLARLQDEADRGMNEFFDATDGIDDPALDVFYNSLQSKETLKSRRKNTVDSIRNLENADFHDAALIRRNIASYMEEINRIDAASDPAAVERATQTVRQLLADKVGNRADELMVGLADYMRRDNTELEAQLSEIRRAIAEKSIEKESYESELEKLRLEVPNVRRSSHHVRDAMDAIDEAGRELERAKAAFERHSYSLELAVESGEFNYNLNKAVSALADKLKRKSLDEWASDDVDVALDFLDSLLASPRGNGLTVEEYLQDRGLIQDFTEDVYGLVESMDKQNSLEKEKRVLLAEYDNARSKIAPDVLYQKEKAPDGWGSVEGGIINSGLKTGVAQKLLSTTSAREAALIIAEGAESPAHRKLAARIAELMPDNVKWSTDSEFIDRAAKNAGAESAAGASRPTGFYKGQSIPGHVVVNPERLTSEVAVHELTHQVTQNQLYRLAHNIEDLSDYDRQLLEDIKALYGKARESLDADEHYGLKNVSEFIAEGMSNPRFQDALRNIKLEDETLWQKLKNIVYRLLGKESDAPTVASELEQAVYELMESRPEAEDIVKQRAEEYLSAPDDMKKFMEGPYFQDDETRIKGTLGLDKSRLVELLGASMYKGSLGNVAVKELVQNAFDATKAAELKGLVDFGKINITVDHLKRTIEVADNGVGMTPETVQKAFFTIAGSDKSDLPPAMRSGGLGLAKMAFIMGSDAIELETVKNGLRTIVSATPTEIVHDNFVLRTSKVGTEVPNGTKVTVHVPKNFVDSTTGELYEIAMPGRHYGILSKSMLGDTEVTYREITEFGGDTSEVLPIGRHADMSNYTHLSHVKFSWGSAEVYISKKPYRSLRSYAVAPEVQVLSSGLFQFQGTYSIVDGSKFSYDVIVDFKPEVEASSNLYPFNNQREGFKSTVKNDIEALKNYISDYERGVSAKQTADVFAGAVPMKRVDIRDLNGGLSEARRAILAGFETDAEKTIVKKAETAEKKYKPAEISIENGAVKQSTKPVEESERHAKATFSADKKYSTGAELFDSMHIDPKKPLFLNNTSVDYVAETLKRLPDAKPDQFLSELGSVVVEFRERAAKAAGRGYEILDDPGVLYATGIAIDKQYKGVHVKVPYRAFFLNPLALKAKSPVGAAEGALHVLVHETAHTLNMKHDENFASLIAELYEKMGDTADIQAFRQALNNTFARNWRTFSVMRDIYEESNVRNLAKSMEDGAKLGTGSAGRAATDITGSHLDDAGREFSRIGDEAADGGAGNVERGPTEGVDDARAVAISRLEKMADKPGYLSGKKKFYQLGEPLDEARKITDEFGDEFPLPDAETVPAGAKGAVQFLQDGRAIVFAFRNPDVSTAVHELGHIMRRDLPDEDLKIIEEWVGVINRQWTVDAEEKFARGFEKYLYDGKAPTSLLDRAFAKLKTWMRSIYSSLTNSPIDYHIPDEVRGVYDRLLGFGSETTKTLEDALNTGPPSAIEKIVADLASKGVNVDADDLYKQFESGQTILLDEKALGKKAWTPADVSRLQDQLDSAATMAAGPKQPSLSLDARRAQTVESEPVEAARSFVASKVPPDSPAAIAANAAMSVMFGGDAEEMYRHLPPTLRKGIAAASRLVSAAFNDASTLAHETGLNTLIKYLGGERVSYRAGRDVASSGYNFASNIINSFNKYWAELPEGTRAIIQAFAFNEFPEKVARHEIVGNAVDDFLYATRMGRKKPPQWLAEMLDVIGAVNVRSARAGANVSDVERQFIALLLNFTGNAPDTKMSLPERVAKIKKAGKVDADVAKANRLDYLLSGIDDTDPNVGMMNVEDAFKPLDTPFNIHGADPVAVGEFLNGITKIFDEDAARKAGILIAAFGSEKRAYDALFDVGATLSDADTKIFLRRLNGEHLPPGLMKRADEIMEKFGVNPYFKDPGGEAFELADDGSYVVPATARNRIQGQLKSYAEQLAKKDENSPLAHAGENILRNAFKYMHGRMVKGGFFAKPRQYWNQTFDIFNGVFDVSGLRPAIVATCRTMAQQVLAWELIPSIPGTEIARILHTAQLVTGGTKLGEVPILTKTSKAIQAGSDEAARFIGKLLALSKYRAEVNKIVEGADETIKLGGRTYTYKHLREIALQEGIFSNVQHAYISQVEGAAPSIEAANKRASALRQKLNELGNAASYHTERLFEVPEEIMELWGNSERVGIYATYIEAGMAPRDAARLAIKSQFDYGYSMSKFDRSLWVKMLVPFWPFQKNANILVANLMLSPAGWYRLGVMNKFWKYGADMLTGLDYRGKTDPYGIDIDALPPDQLERYWALRLGVESAFKGARNVPEEVSLMMRMGFSNQATIVVDGQMREANEYFQQMLRDQYVDGHEGPQREEILPFRSINTTGAYQPQPEKSARSSYLRDRDAIRLTPDMSYGDAVYKYYTAAHPNHPMTEIVIPDNIYRSAMRWFTYFNAGAILAAEKMLTSGGIDVLGDEDDGMEYVLTSTPIAEIIDPTKAPITADMLDWFNANPKGRMPKRVSPKLAALVENWLPVDLMRTSPEADPFTTSHDDSSMVSAMDKEMYSKLFEAEPNTDVEVANTPMRLKNVRYYMAPGPGSMIFYMSPIGELNEKYLAMEKTPLEENQGTWGDLLAWARGVVGVQTAEEGTGYEANRTAGHEETEFTDTNRKPDAKK